MKVKFVAPSIGVTIEPDRLILYTIDPGAGVEIPLFYCSMSAYTGRGEDATSIIVSINVYGKVMYLDEEGSGYAPSCVAVQIIDADRDAWQGEHMICHCRNADLCISALEILSAVDDLDGAYLSMHGDDLNVIRNVSMTASLTAKARAIVDISYAGPGSAKRYEKIRKRRKQ